MPRPHRQTITYLTNKFREVGLEPDARHGQNFLVDLNLVELLVRSGEIDENDVVLEVGTGTGSLTAMIAEVAAAVVTVEIDDHLYQLARESLEDFDNIVMLKQDALRNKNNFQQNVIDEIQRLVDLRPNRRFKLVANLPYNVATPVLSNLMTTSIVPTTMTATIQKELADRICAKPSTKDYSALSIWMQSLCDVETVRIMSPRVFWPRPKVTSAIIKVTSNSEKRARIPDVDFFHTFVRSLFFHRRKFLRGVLVSSMKGKLSKPEVDGILAKLGYKEDARAEQLEVDAILILCEEVRKLLIQKGIYTEGT